MRQDQQMTRWHADMVTSLRTHRQITFLKDTLRDPQKGNQMGPGKSCAVFYSPSVIIQRDSLSLLWCVKCCARFYKNLAAGQMFALKRCEKWEWSLRVCLYDHNTWVLYSAHQSWCIQYPSLLQPESSISSSRRKKKTRHPKLSFSIVCCKCFGTYAECLCWSTL